MNSSFERAAKQFVVRRDEGKTVIAGYPWFLDWGRDSLICARGLLAAGMVEEVKQILLTFAKFEKDGTLPNTIHGDDASNRDTSDAPLWFAVVCEESFDADRRRRLSRIFRCNIGGRRDAAPSATCWRASRKIIRSGTPNGIRMDADSALIWSPGHFTWMDTNHPAGTPREGYPVEIQVLWIRLLRQLGKNQRAAPNKKNGATWPNMRPLRLKNCSGSKTKAGLPTCCWPNRASLRATPRPSDALRSNCLFAVSLGLVTGERAKRCVEAAQKYLVVPGALRSLAPLPVSVPLPIYRQRRPVAEQSRRAVLAALRRRRGHAPQTGVSQRHGVDVDVPGFLRGAGARVGFFAGSRRGGEKLSRQRGKIDERRLPRPDSGNSGRRCAAHATRLRRAGVGRDRNAARVEMVEFAGRAGKMTA